MCERERLTDFPLQTKPEPKRRQYLDAWKDAKNSRNRQEVNGFPVLSECRRQCLSAPTAQTTGDYKDNNSGCDLYAHERSPALVEWVQPQIHGCRVSLFIAKVRHTLTSSRIVHGEES